MRVGAARVALVLLLVLLLGSNLVAPAGHAQGVPAVPAPAALTMHLPPSTPAPSPVTNFTNSINRLVELVAAAGGGILALVWARVAMSWFSNDITKKVQAKDRARDALLGTLVFTAAITGLVWGLAQWVLTGA